MRLRSGVHPILTEAAGALLDERSGQWTQLTGTAAVALRLLLESEERRQAVERYAAWFAVPREQAEQDLATVERGLANRGLAAAPRRHGRRWRR